MNQQEQIIEDGQESYEDRMMHQQNIVNNNVTINNQTYNVQSDDFIPRIKSEYFRWICRLQFIIIIFSNY